jgi:outer membrane protein OmpA-like peptidoglycan-associated protein
MSMNLLDSVTSLLTPDLVGKAASFLGENESSVTKALSGIAPSVLQGIISKVGSDGGAGVLDMAKQAAGSGILDNLSGLFGSSGSSMMSLGSSLLSGLFGTKSSGLASLISNFAGIKSSSSTSLLSALAPMALGLIGKHVASNGLSGINFLSWLTGQKDAVSKAVPAGLNLSSIFGNDSDKSKETVHSFKPTAREPEPSIGLPKWLLPLLLLLLGAIALWYFMKGCNNTTNVSVPVDTVQTVVSAPEPVVIPARESFKIKLVNGVEIDAFKGGIEDKLLACIDDAACVPGKELWFDFDDINFDMASANITTESQRQVKNIADILKAYPKLKIKIGGYTDKTGDAVVNKKLSQDRADAVTTAIVAAGAAASQLEKAEGYGSAFAKIAAEAPDEERKADRRISVSLRAK